MIELKSEEVKAIELEILKYIRQICHEHNIKYYLAYGTLIGAIRHKGFIPWDDDIDIFVPVEQYDKLIRAISEKKDRYRILSWDRTPNYIYPFAKVVDSHTRLVELDEESIEDLGVYVDVFPIVGLTDNKFANKRFQMKMKYLIREWHYAKSEDYNKSKNTIVNLIRRARFTIAKRKGLNYWLKTIDSIQKNMPSMNASRVGDIYSSNSSNFLKDHHEAFFENELFSIPSQYHELLTSMYGDYMQLPPEAERVSNHNFKAWYV